MAEIQFRVNPKKRPVCACKSDPSQFLWSLWRRVPDALAKPTLNLARESERKRCLPLHVTPLFQFRIKP